jgi:hypothetical protein
MKFKKSIIYGKCPCCKEWTYIIGVGCEKCQKLKIKLKEK